jgi:hypothetical protein
MKIGINNIFTTFWFSLILVYGGTLTYLSFDQDLFTSDLIFIAKFFVGLVILITTGILIYFFYKFRILFIDNNKIISIHPFWLNKKNIDLTKIKKIKLENFFAFRGTVYRKVTITDSNGMLEINDLEFENFEELTSELKIDKIKKTEIDLAQAKSNYSNMNFKVIILSGLLILLVLNAIWNSGFHLIIIIFFICIGLLLYASVKRSIEYKRIKKTAYNNV